MRLILNQIEPYHWAIAGAGIAIMTLALLFVGNKRLGLSSGFENLCSLVVRVPYFRRETVQQSHGWRLPIFVGLVLGGALSALLGGGWSPTWQLGIFDAVIGFGPVGKILWMFAGGVLIGAGTRMAGGCTSGHGIFGLANFERSGLFSAMAFMAAGIVTSHIIYRLAFGGAL